MKKIVLNLALLATMSLQASEIGANMKAMRDGLLEIQDGFLYNNKETVVSGIAKIEKSSGMLHSKESVEAYMPESKKGMVGVALLSGKNLQSDLQAMSVYIGQNNMLEASSVYSDVIRDCTRCHAVVRGW